LTPRRLDRGDQKDSIQTETLKARGIGRAVIREEADGMAILEKDELTPVLPQKIGKL